MVKFQFLKIFSFKIFFTIFIFLLFSSNFISLDYSSKSLLNHRHDSYTLLVLLPCQLHKYAEFHSGISSNSHFINTNTWLFSIFFLCFFHDQSFFWLLANKLPFPVCSIEWSNWVFLPRPRVVPALHQKLPFMYSLILWGN